MMRLLRCHVGQMVVVGAAAWVAVCIFMWQIVFHCPITSPASCGHDQTPLGKVAGGVNAPMTSVYVIEEHHEALLYWFDAANKGLIKREGNVLFHIDAHSDGAPVEDRSVLPLFRWPSAHDIFNMMQRNDVFIVAAAYTGLIRRYIWVWSPWDVSPEEPDFPDHRVVPIQLGTIFREGADGRVFQDICVCTSTFYIQQVLQEGECFMPNITHLYDEMPGVVVAKDRCRIHTHDGVIELVSEDKAIELMMSGTWITPLDSVILDIDEDYYGCEAAVQPLYDVGLTEDKLMWLKYFVGRLFCASTIYQEKEADKFFASMIDRIVHLKQFCNESTEQLCKDVNEMSKHVVNSIDELYADILVRKLEKTFCSSDKKAKKVLKNIVLVFMLCSIEQLKALKEVGICLMGTPRTKLFTPSVGMRLCDGYNRPNNSMVPFHTPTVNEVTLRTNKLRSMLHTPSLHPGVVTVCRSMRDGFTPRRFFHMIEHDILEVLKEAFPQIYNTSIFYDSHLMGGVFGWPNRH